MPTYEYACKDCGHHFDIFQSFDEDSLTVCPQCQGTLRKKFNSVGVVFKGSGFYRNDSRSSSTGSDAPAPSTTASESSAAAAPSTSSASAASSTAPTAKAASTSD
ncbi:MAG: FmdB family zinc ribbon protein [Galactobacter sp.]